MPFYNSSTGSPISRPTRTVSYNIPMQTRTNIENLVGNFIKGKGKGEMPEFLDKIQHDKIITRDDKIWFVKCELLAHIAYSISKENDFRQGNDIARHFFSYELQLTNDQLDQLAMVAAEDDEKTIKMVMWVLQNVYSSYLEDVANKIPSSKDSATKVANKVKEEYENHKESISSGDGDGTQLRL